MKKQTLLELRTASKTKQKELMELLHIDRKTLYNWEHCRTAPDHWQLQTLCKFYGIKKDALIIADRYDPWSFLPDDKTYEEWKADRDAYFKETMAWYDDHIRRPVKELTKDNAQAVNDFWGRK